MSLRKNETLTKEFFIPLDGADSAFCLRRDADDLLSGHSAGQNVETGWMRLDWGRARARKSVRRLDFFSRSGRRRRRKRRLFRDCKLKLSFLGARTLFRQNLKNSTLQTHNLFPGQSADLSRKFFESPQFELRVVYDKTLTNFCKRI